jgi:RNA polymerase sigma-70 factor, ECF subfamily
MREPLQKMLWPHARALRRSRRMELSNEAATPADTLVHDAQSGNRAALEALLAHSAPQLLRYAQRMCRDRADAEDVLQDALLSATREIGAFRGESSFSSWLYALARSACSRRRRRMLDRPGMAVPLEEGSESRVFASHDPGPETLVTQRETARLLDEALATLDEAAREVLVLRDVEGLTAPEVAHVLGISVEAVKSRLHRARATLRATLEPQVTLGEEEAGLCNHIAQAFSANLEGDLSAVDCAAMETHLRACKRCEVACASLKRTLRRCQVVGAEGRAVPAEVQELVRRALNDAGVRRTEHASP